MARKKKGELPSGNIRRQIYNGMKQKRDKQGNPIFDADGKPVMIRDYISVTADNAKAAERAKADAMLTKKGTDRSCDMTLREAIDKYIELSQNVLSPTTISGYRTIQESAFVMIMDEKLSTFTGNSLQNAVNIESGRKTRRGTVISPKTVSNEFGLISAVLHRFRPDLSLSVKLPQKTKRFHELSEPDVIFNIVKGTEIELPVLLAMWLSFTISEIKGLTKSGSLSADGNYITIKEVVVNVSGKEIRKKQGKAEQRNRKHRLPEYIKNLIDNVPTDELVTLSSFAVSSRFSRMVERNGLPHMTFHDLRHVNASVMAILHIPDKYAQERGGWATDKVMKDTYTQTFSKERIAVDNTIDRYFEEKLFGKREEDKYKPFLLLFNLFDSQESKKLFEEILCRIENMQHEMQHEK